MFLDNPHEIHAPPAKPLSGSRISPVLTWLLAIVSLGGLAAVGWWYVTEVYNEKTPSITVSNNSTAKKQVENTNSTTTVFSDADSDGLSDEVEVLYGTDAHKSDSDDDGFSDGEEVKNGYEPLIAQKGKRMVDMALVTVVSKSVDQPIVVSSGISETERQRYYLVYDGASTSYFSADGSLVVQCTNEDDTGKCGTLPNQIRTDFSRTFTSGVSVDAFHSPF